jgi:hypothetical protein
MKKRRRVYMIETTDIQKFQKRIKDSIRLLGFFEAKKGYGQAAYVLHKSTKNPDELLYLMRFGLIKNPWKNIFNSLILNPWMQR